MKVVNLLLVFIAVAKQHHLAKAFVAVPSSPSHHTHREQLSFNSKASQPTHAAHHAPTMELKMGLFDGIMKAFENDEYGPPPDAVKASARHILVTNTVDAGIVKKKLMEGDGSSSSFASLAREYSTCPSGASGGSLGSFAPGTMVPEFDKVIFSPDTIIGSVIGPVQTKFGYHLIVVDKRTGGGDWY